MKILNWANLHPDQILCQHDGDYSAPRYFYIHDRLGSVRQVVNDQGQVINYYTYQPFGEIFDTENIENVSNSFKFTGQWLDNEIGEYYLRARQYDPYIYRFTSRDPVFGKFEEPMTLHRYLYCGNNPINYTDINGEWALVLGGSLSGNLSMSNLPGFNVSTRGIGSVFEGIGRSFGTITSYYSILMPYYTFASEHIGFGGTGGGAFIVAYSKEVGWTYGRMFWLTGGGSLSTGSSASATIDIGVSFNATRVEDLGSWFTEVGGSVTSPPVLACFGVTAGYSYGIGVKKLGGDPTGITLHTFSIGLGTSTGWGGEVHGYGIGYAWVKEW